MKKPKAVVYVAETSCCGLVIHDPRMPGVPAHHRGSRYESCTVVRFWEFVPKRAISDARLQKMRR